MSEAGGYKLVSAELYRDAYIDPDDTPVYRQWLAYMGSLDRENALYWDEEAVIKQVREMINAAGKIFYFPPDKVKNLQATLERAEAGGVDYLRFAVSKKLQRVIMMLGDVAPLQRYEKLLRNIQRGIERRIDKVAAFDILDLIAKFPRTVAEIEKMTLEEERLEMIIKALTLLQDLRDHLAKKLASLGGPNKAGNPASDFDDDIYGQMDTEDFRAAPEDDGGKGKKKRGRKKKGRGVLAEHGAKQLEPDQDKDSGFDAVKISREKLQRAIEMAKVHGKIRAIVSHRSPARQASERKWQMLFDKLGYDGEIEFLDFEELERSGNGYDIPIVLVQATNTHFNIWQKKRYRNVFVLNVKTQNVLISGLP